MKILLNTLLNFNYKYQLNKKLGGVELLNYFLARELTKLKHNVVVPSNKKIIFTKNKIKFIPLNKVKSYSNNLKFDTIISSNDAKIFNYYNNSKKILWLHNQLQIEKAIRKKQILSIIKTRPIAIFVSNYLKNKTSNLYLFKKRKVIPNFLIPKFINKKVNFLRKPIFVWSVQRSKGLEETISLWSRDIYPNFKNAKFYIYGINKLSNKYNLKNLSYKNIFFKGRVNQSELNKIYSKSMGMICLGYDETFCLNALEANACGLPIISFGKTALKELILNNYNGFIVNDYNLISKKIAEVIRFSKSCRKKFINNSINHSKKYYINKIIYKWNSVFNYQ